MAIRTTVAVQLALGLMACAGAARAGNPIELENAKAGNGDWQIDPASIGTMKTMDVYPARWSLKHGDSIRLRVSTTAATFRTRIYRLGGYGGAGARLVAEVASTRGATQPIPVPDALYGLAECSWKDSLSVPIGSDWTEGVYLARLTGDDGLESQTYFVLRDDGGSHHAPLLFVVSSATHQAYNSWPNGGTIASVGKSLYGWNSSGPDVYASRDVWAVKVSFDRPYAVGAGAGDLLSWEYPFISWLETNGYDVAYATSADVDEGTVLDGRTAIVEAGHDEYWSRGMFDHLQSARDAGVSLAIFGGDVAAWQVRFEPSVSAGPRGILTGFKERAYPNPPATGDWPGDPYYTAGMEAVAKKDFGSARTLLERVTGAWASLRREPSSGIDARRPGMTLTGVVHGGETSGSGFDWVVQSSSHWIYAGTGLRDGDRLSKLVGYEWDNPREGDSSWDDVRPKGQVILARSPADASPIHGASFYAAPSGAGVVAMGSIQWSWALPPDGVGSTPHDARVERITRNVLDRFLSSGSTSFDAGPGSDDAGAVLPLDAGPLDDGGADADDAPLDAASDAEGKDARGDGAPEGSPLDDADGAPIDAEGSTPAATTSAGGCACRATSIGASDAGTAALALLALIAATTARARARRREGRVTST